MQDNLWDNLKATISRVVQARRGFCKWIPKGLLSFALRTGRIFAKILDICFFPKLMDLFWQTIKPGTRMLTPLEEQEARTVFGDSIDYRQVRIDEHSLIAWIGAKIKNSPGMGVATFHTINFNKKIKTAAGNSDMKWLIHELAHVSQMEHIGSKYLIEAFYAQATEGYGYAQEEKPHFCDYNREQQASIAADYYSALISGSSTAPYDMYIGELQAGEF
ncbi:hypothetical protein [Methanosarcina siciliae]|uniref:hypothetical protein n=1 Tax=Methanosarcina siciliae TaxID=38027 RepID=UPI0021C46ED3|nr:hypothetical protein [Methanosarcina siciliae]